jgi:hypothetical protein
MSQENVEIVRRAAEFWTNRDFSPMAETSIPRSLSISRETSSTPMSIAARRA